MITYVHLQNTTTRHHLEFKTVRRARSPSPSRSWPLRYLKNHADIAKILCLENDALQQYLSPSCVQSLSGVQLFVTLWTASCQASCPSLSPGVCSNSYPLSQWCHPTISSFAIPFPPAFNLSQHQDLFQWVTCSHQVAKVLEFQLQHQSFQWIFRTDFL